jgi:serine phosphatase RsbU (regulator of sigma subunit)/Flp pilus assembly protein TadD
MKKNITYVAKKTKIIFQFLFVFVLLLFSFSACAQIKEGSNHSYSFSKDTSQIYSLIRKGRVIVFEGQHKEAMNLATKAKYLSERLNYKTGVSSAMNLQGRTFYQMGNFDSAKIVLNQSLLLAKEVNDSSLQSIIFMNLGNIFLLQGNSSTALDFYFKGLAIEERLIKPSSLHLFYTGIGLCFTNQKTYNKALEYLLKALKETKKVNDENSLGSVYNGLGWLYMQTKQNDSALYALEQCLKISEKTNQIYYIVISLGNLAELYATLKNYNEAYEYCDRGYKLGKEKGYKDQMVGSLITFGKISLQQKKYDDAEKYLTKGMTLSQEINTKELTKDVTLLLASLYEGKGNYKKAYEYYKIFSSTKDSILNKENSKLITEMNTKYTTEKKEKEIELLKKNEDIQNLELSKKRNELEKQRTVSISVFVGFLLLMIVAILTFSRYRLKKKANDQLQNAFNLIEEKNRVIEKSNLMITDSITYAKRIQDAILPAEEELAKIFSEDFFIIYQPSQIVSGDFYWCSQQGNKTIFVVADCTGHGVPGAFMSMIGNTLLNEIVNERKITDTQKIAELLDEKIIYALHQHEDSQQYDGMDISICCIDPSLKEISFTGGHHAMYLYSDRLQKIKGNSFSIGGAQHQHSKAFTAQKISYQKGQNIYFLTDGYCDQPGGNANKRYTSKQFESSLVSIQALAMDDQRRALEQALEKWKGTMKQRDDILVVGIKC